MGLPLLAQRHSWIALVVRESSQQSCIWVFQALDTSHIGNKILAAVALDLAPFLIWQIFYSVYLDHLLYEKITSWTLSTTGRALTPSPYSLRNWKGRLTGFDKKFLSRTINIRIKGNITMLILRLKNVVIPVFRQESCLLLTSTGY